MQRSHRHSVGTHDLLQHLQQHEKRPGKVRETHSSPNGRLPPDEFAIDQKQVDLRQRQGRSQSPGRRQDEHAGEENKIMTGSGHFLVNLDDSRRKCFPVRKAQPPELER